jgi:hypothetical protein
MGLKCAEYELDNIQKIQFNCKLFKIRVVGCQSGKLELSWRDTSTRSLIVEQQNDELVIKDRAAIALYGALGLIDLKRDSQLLIKVPQTYQGIITLQSNEEKIHLTDVKTNGNIGIASNTGEIVLENAEAKVIDIRGNNGKINCFAIKATEIIDISSEHGSIACCLNDHEENYTIYCKTQNRGCNFPECKGDGHKKLRITSKMGSISVEFQEGNLARNISNRYNRQNSFKDW